MRQWNFLREVKLFRPYPDEVPWALFDSLPSTLPEGELEALVANAQENRDDTYLRVAKLQAEVLGAYILRRRNSASFELKYLAVEPRQRRKGLGRWLTGHAIGVAESKGGRRVQANPCALDKFLRAYGFVDAESQLAFEFVPE